MANDLTRRVRELEQCAPADRIHLREPILVHGAEAIRELEALAIRRPELAASIAAWLEVLARRDTAVRPGVVAALRRMDVSVPAAEARYAREALDRLGASTTSAPRTSGSRARGVLASAGTDWPGFQAHEFGRNEGTRWRSADGRHSLAPILLRQLQRLDPDFISFGVERSPEIHFAVSRRYRGALKSGFTASKLAVCAHGPTDEAPDTPRQIVAGWYIERGDGSDPKYGDPADASRWDWPLVMRSLGKAAFRDSLTVLMLRYGLRFGDYGLARYTSALGWTAQIEEGTVVARNERRKVVARGWDELRSRLDEVPAAQWVDLHLFKTWPEDEAIEAGQPFAHRELAPLLLDIAPLYLETVGTRSTSLERR